MLGKILIVDAIATNRIVLKVKLASAFYEVLQAGDQAEAILLAQSEAPDLIICAMSLPDGSAVALFNVLRTEPLTRDIPVIALSEKADHLARVAALEGGVHDVISRPCDDAWLLGRVRSLIRAQNTSAEWRVREETSAALGMAEPRTDFVHPTRILMVSAESSRVQHWRQQLTPLMRGRIELSRGRDLLQDIQDGGVPDAIVLISSADPVEKGAVLRMISTLRANAQTRHAALMVIQANPDGPLAAQALDLGADDAMMNGFEAAELSVRLKTLVKRKRLDAQLRDTYRSGVKAAVVDPLTGLYNRRYAIPQLTRIAAHAQRNGHPFAVMVADLDHFKRINDIYGHASGDAVLVEVAKRLRTTMRPNDLVARIGGEEFLIVLPATTPEEARDVAIRICNDIGALPFDVPGDTLPIPVTISIGMAIGCAPQDGPQKLECSHSDLLDQADKALYAAKTRGRNRVKFSRPAA